MSSVLVGSAYGVLELRSQQFDQGVDASLAKLAQLRQAFSQGIPPLTLPPIGGGLPGAGGSQRQLPGGLAPDIQKDEQAMVRYASSLAAAQKAQGDLSGAASTYRNVLGQLTPNTIEANRVTAQLASTEAALAKEAAGSGGAIEAIGGKLSGLVSPAALATAGIGALIAAASGAIELAKVGAEAERTATAFDTLASRANTSGDVLLGALRKASGGEVSDLNLELAATKAEFTGVATSASDFSRLMAIARNNSREFGISTADGFNRLIDALDRGQVRGLKQIGLNIDLKKAEADYAQSIGVTVASLDEEQKRQALVQATLALGEQQLQKTGGAASDTASGQERLGASFDNLKAKAGSFVADGVAPTVNSLSDLLNGFDGTTSSMADASVGAQNLGLSIAGLPALTNAQQQAQRGWTQSVLDWIAAREVQIGLAQAPSSGGGGSFTFADPAVINDSTAAQRAYADSLELTGVRTRAAALAAEQKSNADKLAATDSQTHALAVKQLDEQVTAAANALLTEGPAGARAAALLAGSSSLVDQRTAAEYRLLNATIAVNNANNQKATDQAVATGRFFGRESGRGGGSDAAGDSAAFVAALQKQYAEQQKLLDSEIALAGAKKQTAREIDLLRQKQSQYAKGTAEYNQIEAQIIGVQTAGGRARVSAAASTGLQLQNVEENTQAQLLKTQREGLERMRDQQQDFDLSRSRKQEDFGREYRKLLAQGQRARAKDLKDEFELKQRRDQEDYTIARQRTLRNNAESTGDITGAADRRTDQIDARAALRGVRPGGASLGSGATPAIGGGASGSTVRGPLIIGPLTIAPSSVQIDGKQFVEITWPQFEIKIDDEFSASLRAVGAPNSNQAALAGTAP